MPNPSFYSDTSLLLQHQATAICSVSLFPLIPNPIFLIGFSWFAYGFSDAEPLRCVGFSFLKGGFVYNLMM